MVRQLRTFPGIRSKWIGQIPDDWFAVVINEVSDHMGTLELGGQTGNVCKEIYGAGESIGMYLLFEALGKISDTSFG